MRSVGRRERAQLQNMQRKFILVCFNCIDRSIHIGYIKDTINGLFINTIIFYMYDFCD
jgi:hypothetical protein